MAMFDREALEDARRTVRRHMPSTPQYAWPLLAEATGCEVLVKHENHSPTGAFKIRGGLVLLDGLRRSGFRGRLVSATRGNHGQSLSLAGRLHGVGVTIVVPEGNDPDQNAAMRGFGATVVEHGRDYQAAREHAGRLAQDDDALLVPPFAPELVRGVASYALELFEAAGDLDVVYVPIGMGSGICGLITARDVLGLATRIVGVVAAGAPAYALSFAAGSVVRTDAAETFADGVATRSPDPDALDVILAGAADVVMVNDDAIADALRLLYRCTHNVAEGAGAVALAGLLEHRREGTLGRGSRAGVVLTGGNIAMPRLARLLGSGAAVAGRR